MPNEGTEHLEGQGGFFSDPHLYAQLLSQTLGETPEHIRAVGYPDNLSNNCGTTLPRHLQVKVYETRHKLANLFFAASKLNPDMSDRTDDELVMVKQQSKRLYKCGETFVILKHLTKHNTYKPILTLCNSKHCPHCAAVRSFVRTLKVWRHIEHAIDTDKLTHAVLTVPNCAGHLLRATLEKLQRAFRRFRGSQGGKSTAGPIASLIQGGIWNLEISFNADRHDWHPHIHLLIQAPYLDQDAVSDEWATAARAEGFRSRYWNVFLKKVGAGQDDLKSAVLETCKYVCKPLRSDACTLDDWVDLIVQTHNMRHAGQWGCFVLDRESITNPTVEWENLGGLNKFLKEHAGTKAESLVKDAIVADKRMFFSAMLHYSITDLVSDHPKKETSKCNSQKPKPNA